MNVVSNVKVYGLEDSIKASKYPMSVDIDSLNSDITPTVLGLGNAKSGSGHSQFLHGIIVQFDLTLTIKAWTEAERYHWFEFVSSQSTMHRITKFDLDKSYIEYVDPRIIQIMKEKIKLYNMHMDAMKKAKENGSDITMMQEEAKELYLKILYSNPCGFQLTARMTTNYEQLKTMYNQRNTHRLPEWPAFCKWILTLPMFKELCLKDVQTN